MPLLKLKMWLKLDILIKQFISLTPLKPLNIIHWHIVVLQNILCKYSISHALGLDIVFIQWVLFFLSPSLGYLQKIFFFLREQIELWPENLFCATCVKPVEHEWQKNCSVWYLFDSEHSITTYMQLCFCVPLSIIDAWHCHLLRAALSRMLERWVCELPHYFFNGIQKRL